MTKVFCSECLHFQWEDADRQYKGLCCHPNNMSSRPMADNFYRPGPEYIEMARVPADINAHNDCQWWERNTWKEAIKKWIRKIHTV